MKKKKYPYQNLALDDLKREEWKDVPGLDGYCRISNFGRMKRLRYELLCRNGMTITKPEKILKTQFHPSPNHLKNDISEYPVNGITVSGKHHTFMLARLVYHCFIEELGPADDQAVIICKDGNTLNISLKNLVKATKHDRQQRMYDRERSVSNINHISDEGKEKREKAIIEKVSKKITQYSPEGLKMATFNSAQEASRKTGIPPYTITAAVLGTQIWGGGFIWQRTELDKIDVNQLLQERLSGLRKKYGQKLTQYDMQGNKLNQFPSIQDAAIATGANENAIRLVLKGTYKSAKGYFFKKGYGRDKIDLSKHNWGIGSGSAENNKPVSQFTPDGKLIRRFPSIKAAATSLKCSPVQIGAACRGKIKSSQGYIWKFNDK